MKKHNQKILGISLGLMTMMFVVGAVHSGDLEPIGPPAPTMRSLDEIYDKMIHLDYLLSRVLEDRFFVREDGTVSDLQTGLIWDQNANRFPGGGAWQSADYFCSQLAADSQHDLNDASEPGYWRLPTLDELSSLLDLDFTGPALSNAEGNNQWSEGNAFSGVTVSSSYWTSTLNDPNPNAWTVSLNDGSTFLQDLEGDAQGHAFAWCVH